MKNRFVALLLFVCILTSCLSLLVSATVTEKASTAAAEESNAKNEKSELDALSFSCVYEPKTSSVEINGTTKHSTMLSNSNARLEVYALRPGMSVSDLGFNTDQPIAQSDITIKFHFSIHSEHIFTRYSRYVIFLRSPDGTVFQATEPQYPMLESELEIPEKDPQAFKGISSFDISVSNEIVAGTTLIPVDLERLLNKDGNGYLHQNENTILYFDFDVVKELDLRIQSASMQGGKVYLQLLLPASSSWSYVQANDLRAQYCMPNLYSEAVLNGIEGAASFLTARYDSVPNGLIHGFVVGKGIDSPADFQYAGDISAERYLDLYLLYLLAVTNGAGIQRAGMDLVIPFTAVDSYEFGGMQGSFLPSALLELLLVKSEQVFARPLSFTTLIETDINPIISATDSNQKFGVRSDTESAGWLGAHNFTNYTSYLKALSQKYSFAPRSCMLVWNIPDDLKGIALASAYVYSYLALQQNATVSSFVISFSQNDSRCAELKYVLKKIDAKNGLTDLNFLSEYFGKKSWIEWFPSAEIANRDSFSATAQTTLPSDIKGTFVYESYSGHIETGNWVAGNACNSVQSGVHSDYGRALKMDFSLSSDPNAYSEALCLYEFEEIFTYTPYLAFDLFVDGTKGSVYEVKITIGNKRNCLETVYAISAGSSERMLLDLRCFGEEFQASHLRIGIRSLAEGEQTASVWLKSVSGYSTQYSHEELIRFIGEERKAIRNDALQQPPSDRNRVVWFLFATLCVIGSVAISMLILFYRRDRNNDG